LAGGPILGLSHGLITWFVITLLSLRQTNLTRMSALLGITVSFGQQWALYWLGIALCFGVAGAFLELRPTETIRVSMADVSSRLGRAVGRGLLLGLTVWLGFCPIALSLVGNGHELVESPGIREMATLGFPSALLTSSLAVSLIVALGIGLFIVPIVGLIAGLIVLVCGEAVEARTSPNQGTLRSARTAVTAVLILGLSGGLLGLLGSGPSFKPGDAGDAKGLILGLMCGLTCGLIVGMVAGGLFSLRHFVVRLALRINGLAPFSYVRFLDDAVERLFLRKVGGGYIFIHRAVMEYFASLTNPEESDTP
jgi:hypothetical protein